MVGEGRQNNHDGLDESQNTANNSETSRRGFLTKAGTAVVATGGLANMTQSAVAGGEQKEYTQRPLYDFPRFFARGRFKSEKGRVERTGPYSIPSFKGLEYPNWYNRPLIIVAHGWQNSDDDLQALAYTFKTGSDPSRLDDTVYGFSWDANIYTKLWEFQTSKTIAQKVGEDLALVLYQYIDPRRRAFSNSHPPIILIGHSLGCQVICGAVRKLHNWRFQHSRFENTIDRVHFCGGAVSHEDIRGKFHESLDFIVDEIYNYHSSNDSTLGKWFRLSEGRTAIGRSWVNSNLTNWQNVNVSGRVGNHSEYIKKESEGWGAVNLIWNNSPEYAADPMPLI